jgi:hypothetical protein
VYGESLEGCGPGEEGKVPTKDLLAYCYVKGRMTFDIGEEDAEAREVIEALEEEAITITPEDSQRVLERVGKSRESERGR